MHSHSEKNLRRKQGMRNKTNRRELGSFSTFFFFVFATILFFFVFLLFQNRAIAQTELTPEQQKELEKEQNKREDQLDDIKNKIKTYQKISDLKEKESNTLSTEADHLEAQSTDLEGNIAKNERRLADLDQQIESLKSKISEKEKIIQREKDVLAELLRSYSASRTRANSPAVLLASYEEVAAALSGRDRFYELGNVVGETLDSIQQLRTTLANDRDDAAKKQDDLKSVTYGLEQQNIYLENTKKKKEALALAAQAEQDKYDGLVSNLQKQQKALEEEIEQLEAAKEGKIDLSNIPGFGSGVLAYPISKSSTRISQYYGKATCKTCGYTFHNGIDFAGSVGTPIYSAESGKVVGVGNEGKYYYGKWVAVQHDNGLTTLYGHLSSQKVKKGEKVKRGETIGLMGSTGNSTGPHLHFSVFTTSSFEIVNSTSVKGITVPIGAHINPAKYL